MLKSILKPKLIENEFVTVDLPITKAPTTLNFTNFLEQIAESTSSIEDLKNKIEGQPRLVKSRLRKFRRIKTGDRKTSKESSDLKTSVYSKT